MEIVLKEEDSPVRYESYYLPCVPGTHIFTHGHVRYLHMDIIASNLVIIIIIALVPHISTCILKWNLRPRAAAEAARSMVPVLMNISPV